MTYNEMIENASCIGNNKVKFLRSSILRYMISAIYAGVFIGMGVLVSFTLSGLFVQAGQPHVARLLNAIVFSVALILIIFTSTELFTGNNFIMTLSTLNKRTSLGNLLSIWAASWIGNLIGAIILGFIFSKTGLLENEAVLKFFQTTSHMKATLSPVQLISRAILCNFTVCTAVMVSMRTKSDPAKIMVTILLIITFVVSGFEHSVANMTVYSVALLGKTGAITISQAAYGLIMASIGNIIGGAGLLGCGIFMLKEKY